MRKTITQHDILARLLQQGEDAPAMDCGQRGICRKCRVKLLSGLWLADGKPVKAPAEVLSCRTRLLGDAGEVEFTPYDAKLSVSADWILDKAMPVIPEAVIGIDIGTTTLAAVKLKNGQIVSRAAAANPQAAFGADVISRIAAAEKHLVQLSTLIHNAVDALLDELGMDDVTCIAIAGNTVMTSLFHQVDPTPIGTAPFQPVQRVFPEIIRRQVPLYTVPCISGFLGGDLTAGINEIALAENEMLVDIGTNCEIIFRTPRGMIGTSAAAGPAFEQYGIQAQNGAIGHLFSFDDFTVIGDTAPKGLCGSALIDFLAVARKNGLLDERGLYTAECDFPFAPSAEDVAELLKAKAAVFAGIRSLENFAGSKASRIWLAGGFARHLDLANAVFIGMLPEREFRVVGNSALAGACRLAADPSLMGCLKNHAAAPQEISLNTLPGFEKIFIEALSL